MTATEQIIKDAIEGGWRGDESVAKGVFENGDFFGGNAHWKYPLHRMIKRVSVEVMLLDPAFWQAVGKTRGWIDEDYPNGEMRCENLVGRCDTVYCDYGGFIDPNSKWHNFIDHLADGLNIEEALAKLD